MTIGDTLSVAELDGDDVSFPDSSSLTLSASFAIFEYLTFYVSVLMLLMRGYSLKCTYSILNFPYLFNIGNFVFCTLIIA